MFNILVGIFYTLAAAAAAVVVVSTIALLRDRLFRGGNS
jgi:hypothetical protein